MATPTETKVVVVTGSNKGIGLGIVKALCKQFDQSAVVYLTARDKARGEEAVAELQKHGLSPKFHALDIDNLESIRTFGKYLSETHGGVDILVNNAGIYYDSSAPEPFAVIARETVRVNYFGTLNVCHELFPLLRAGARVVNLSSCEGYLYRIDGKEPLSGELRAQFASADLTEEKLSEMMTSFIKVAQEGLASAVAAGWPRSNSTYVVSKVGISALTRVQQRELDVARPGQDILVNSVHPGFVKTDMTSQWGTVEVDEGAKAPVWCALLAPNVAAPRGGYVWCDTQVLEWAGSLAGNQTDPAEFVYDDSD